MEGVTSLIELLLGKLFIYLFLVVLTCTLVEIALTTVHARSKILQFWLMRLFDKEMVRGDGTRSSLGQSIMDHSAITGLARRGSSPTYITSRNFTSVLLEKISFDVQNPKVMAGNIDETIFAIEHTKILSTELQRILLGYALEAKEFSRGLDYSGNATIHFRSKVENWFDTSMDDLAGVFKIRYARPFTLFFSVLLTFILNADSIRFAKLLYTDSIREKVATTPLGLPDSVYFNTMNALGQMSFSTSKDSLTIQELKINITSMKKSIDSFNAETKELAAGVPIGWNNKHLFKPGTLNLLSIFEKIFGLLSTAMIVFILSPFLFDMANKISNIRGAGRKPVSTSDFPG
jgi:hypothetical protein